jgi:GTPase SAR1 family protein
LSFQHFTNHSSRIQSILRLSLIFVQIQMGNRKSYLCTNVTGKEGSDAKSVSKSKVATNRKTVNVVLLGPGESGKTTILNQCCILYENDDQLLNGMNIKATLIYQLNEALFQLISLCRDGVEPKNQESARIMKDRFPASSPLSNNVDLKMQALQLWSDQCVQEAWRNRRNETIISDGMEYFLAKINTVMDDSWTPTDYDKVRFTKKTNGILKTVFRIRDDLDMCLWDVGGRLSERKKWATLHNEHFDYIFFVANIADYNRTMYEMNTENSLEDCLNLFGQVVSTKAYENVSIVLIFNKMDLFKEKIVKFGDFAKYFPDYKGAPNDVDAVIVFLREMFLDKVSTLGCMRTAELFSYEINAIDAESVKHLLEAVTEDI